MSWTWEDLLEEQEKDKEIGPILTWMKETSEQPPWEIVALSSSGTKTLWNQWKRLAMHQGVLRRRFENVNCVDIDWQVIIPKIYRYQLLKVAHEGMTGGHLGHSKTAAAIQSRAYWPTWKSDLAVFMRECEPCARYHRGNVKHQAPMQTPHVGEPWERVSVDITGPHPRSSRGKVYILTIVDHFSKWAEAVSLSNHTAPIVAKALMTHVFTKYGAPKQLLSDQGPEFESNLFKELLKWMEIDKIRCSPYRPSTNAVCERFHRTLNSMLGKVVKESERDWDEKLPQVMAAYRASPHSSTGFTPNHLFLGRETKMPLDLIMGVPPEDEGQPRSTDDFVQKVKEDAEACYELARKNLQVNAERRKKTYDVRVKKANFALGDWVWYYYPRRYTRKSPKWQKMYDGPFLIIRVIEPVNYMIQRSPRARKIVVHVDKLKKCFGETTTSWLSPSIFPETVPVNVTVTENVRPSANTTSRRGSARNNISDVLRCDDGNTGNHEVVNPDANSGKPRREIRRAPAHLRDFQC